MKILPRAILGLLATLSIALLLPVSGARAGANEEATIMVHLVATTTKNECTRSSAHPYCLATRVAGLLYPTRYFAYLLVSSGNPGPGIAGLECGIGYNAAPHAGIDVFDWHLCADSEAPVGGWPAPGGGNTILWDAGTHCQRNEPGGPRTGVVATAGYFYCAAYTPDIMSAAVNPVSAHAAVVDCAGNVEIIAPSSSWYHLGSAVFSESGFIGGYVACQPCSDCGGPRIDCNMAGPASCVESQTVDYTTTVGSIGSDFTGVTWALTGPAHFVGPTDGQATVHVHADGPGSVRLECTIDGYHGREHCEMNIAVTSAVPTERATWSGIKALYRG